MSGLSADLQPVAHRELREAWVESPGQQFALLDHGNLGGNQVTQAVGGIVPGDAGVVRIHFQDVLGTGGIVLERGQAIHQPLPSAMDEEAGAEGSLLVPEALEDFSPPVNAVGVGRAQAQVEVGILFGDGEAVALAGEDVRAGGEPSKIPDLERAEWLGVPAQAAEFRGEAVPGRHGPDGFGMARGHSVARGVFVQDVAIVVAVAAEGETIAAFALVSLISTTVTTSRRGDGSGAGSVVG